jgi:undecaprenyl-diphosphatase
MNNLEIKINQLLQNNNYTFFYKFMQIVSNPFSLKIFIVILLILFLMKKINKSHIFMVTMAQIIIFILKHIIRRRRPYDYDNSVKNLDILSHDKYSFPSGHTLNAYLLNFILNNSLSFLPFLVGFSRVYLGVHYVSDIIGAFILGKVIINHIFL